MNGKVTAFWGRYSVCRIGSGRRLSVFVLAFRADYGHMAVELAEQIQHPGALGMSYMNLAFYEL